METLTGRVAVITGGGRGLGREHALLFAAEGARVVVNDLGGESDGTGADASLADEVADEIRSAGGEAVANHDNVADWAGAQRLIQTAVETFGDLHVLVNNAGILRDRMIVSMTEADWDAAVNVNLKGHAAPLHHAAAYWRERSRAGDETRRAVINTSSTSGLFGNVGQSNYGAAKMGVAALTIIASKELSRYNVRVNAIAPAAHTRLTAGIARPADEDPRAALARDPANISPFVAYLATEKCPINGRVFFVKGGEIQLYHPWARIDAIETPGRWTVEDLAVAAPKLGEVPFNLGLPGQ